MTTTSIVIIILLAYIAVMFLVGKYAGKRIHSFRDAIAAPGQTTLWLLVGSAIGSHIGSGFVVGGAEYGALYGIGGAWYGIACGLSYLAVAAISGFIYRNKFISVSDYFTQRYRGKAPRLIYSIATICGVISALAGQLLAGRAIFQALGMPSRWGVVLTAVVALILANLSGLLGSMAASSLQSVIIFFGIVVAFVAAFIYAGPQVLTQLPETYFDPIPFDGEFLVSITLPLILSALVYQMGFQTIVSTKSAKTAFWGYTLAGLILLPIAFIPPVLGMFGRKLFPELAPSAVFMELLMTKLPPVVAAIILAAIICAVIASCNGSYVAVATSFVHDIYQGMLAPQADSKTCRRLMLVVDVAACGVAILLALRMNDIIQLLSMGYSILAAGCLVPFFGGVLWKRGTTAGALASAVVGIAATVGSTLGLIHLPYASITSVALAAVVFVGVSLACPEPKKA